MLAPFFGCADLEHHPPIFKGHILEHGGGHAGTVGGVAAVGISEEQSTVLRELGMQTDIEESPLPIGVKRGYTGNRLGQKPPGTHPSKSPVTFRDKHVAIGQPSHAPGVLEPGKKNHAAKTTLGRHIAVDN